ncbi:hypothetical protein ACFYO7_18295 [Nocardia salmonicida]|uniref:hypothetical protein n=1 Tax=Nocardia salmonicida TaxID=53431 RepID=UPI0036D004A7
MAGLDVVISAVNAGHGIADTIAKAGDFVVGARAMVGALQQHPDIRLIVVGGDGSLEVAPGLQLVDTPDFTRVLTEELRVPAEYREPVRQSRSAECLPPVQSALDLPEPVLGAYRTGYAHRLLSTRRRSTPRLRHRYLGRGPRRRAARRGRQPAPSSAALHCGQLNTRSTRKRPKAPVRVDQGLR